MHLLHLGWRNRTDVQQKDSFTSHNLVLQLDLCRKPWKWYKCLHCTVCQPDWVSQYAHKSIKLNNKFYKELEKLKDWAYQWSDILVKTFVGLQCYSLIWKSAVIICRMHWMTTAQADLPCTCSDLPVLTPCRRQSSKWYGTTELNIPCWREHSRCISCRRRWPPPTTLPLQCCWASSPVWTQRVC